MTIDQQLTDIIAAARRQIMTQFDERMKGLTAEVDQAASADWAAAVENMRLAAEAEIVKRIDEAVAASESEAARRTQIAVEASEADAARRLDEATAAARADLEQRLDRAAADARAEADERIAAATSAAAEHAEETARQTATQALIDSQVGARQSELAQIDRVVEAVRRFDKAQSLTEVLDALGDVTSREAQRVALFLVRGSHLACWRATGFGPALDPHAIEVARGESSLLWRACLSGQTLSTTDAPAGERIATPFGELGDDAAGLAVPVRVGGETVAVIYADDAAEGPRVVPSAWPEVVEVMARHAARCLEVLTVSRTLPPTPTASATLAGPLITPPERTTPPRRAEDDESASRYARLLVSEIKLYHEAAVTQARHDHNLAERLRSEIDRARQLYEERVPVEIRNRTDHFGQELVRTLANGDPTLLGSSGT